MRYISEEMFKSQKKKIKINYKDCFYTDMPYISYDGMNSNRNAVLLETVPQMNKDRLTKQFFNDSLLTRPFLARPLWICSLANSYNHCHPFLQGYLSCFTCTNEIALLCQGKSLHHPTLVKESNP